MSPAPSVSAIPTKYAHLLTISFAFSYVGSLYIFKNARLSFSATAHARHGQARQKVLNERWRDDPDVIQARLASVSLATLVSSLGVFVVVWQSLGGGKPVSQPVRRLNVPLNNVDDDRHSALHNGIPFASLASISNWMLVRGISIHTLSHLFSSSDLSTQITYTSLFLSSGGVPLGVTSFLYFAPGRVSETM
jgi:hypothetical protein